MKPIRHLTALLICATPGMILHSILTDFHSNLETMASLYNRIVGE